MILRITTADGRHLQFHAPGASGLSAQHARIAELREVSAITASLASRSDYQAPSVTCTLGRAAARWLSPDPLLGAEAVVLDRALRVYARGRVDGVRIGRDQVAVEVVA